MMSSISNSSSSAPLSAARINPPAPKPTADSDGDFDGDAGGVNEVTRPALAVNPSIIDSYA